MLITSTQAKAIRRKQADKNLTAKKASEEIGVNPITYKKNSGRWRSKAEHLPKGHAVACRRLLERSKVIIILVYIYRFLVWCFTTGD